MAKPDPYRVPRTIFVPREGEPAPAERPPGEPEPQTQLPNPSQAPGPLVAGPVDVFSPEKAPPADPAFPEGPDSLLEPTENDLPGARWTLDAAKSGDAALDAVLDDRTATYGNADLGQRALGRMLRGLLEHHFQTDLPGEIPGHVVALFFSISKAARAAIPRKFNADNYVDLKNYANIAQSIDPRAKEPR